MIWPQKLQELSSKPGFDISLHFHPGAFFCHWFRRQEKDGKSFFWGFGPGNAHAHSFNQHI